MSERENGNLVDNDITGLWASRTSYEVKGFISFWEAGGDLQITFSLCVVR